MDEIKADENTVFPLLTVWLAMRAVSAQTRLLNCQKLFWVEFFLEL